MPRFTTLSKIMLLKDDVNQFLQAGTPILQLLSGESDFGAQHVAEATCCTDYREIWQTVGS